MIRCPVEAADGRSSVPWKMLHGTYLVTWTRMDWRSVLLTNSLVSLYKYLLSKLHVLPSDTGVGWVHPWLGWVGLGWVGLDQPRTISQNPIMFSRILNISIYDIDTL